MQCACLQAGEWIRRKCSLFSTLQKSWYLHSSVLRRSSSTNDFKVSRSDAAHSSEVQDQQLQILITPNTQLQRAVVTIPWESHRLQPLTTSARVLMWLQRDRMFISALWKYFNISYSFSDAFSMFAPLFSFSFFTLDISYHWKLLSFYNQTFQFEGQNVWYLAELMPKRRNTTLREK